MVDILKLLSNVLSLYVRQIENTFRTKLVVLAIGMHSRSVRNSLNLFTIQISA